MRELEILVVEDAHGGPPKLLLTDERGREIHTAILDENGMSATLPLTLEGRSIEEWRELAVSNGREALAAVERLEEVDQRVDPLAAARRSGALSIAARAWPNHPEPALIAGAERIARWIETGEYDGPDDEDQEDVPKEADPVVLEQIQEAARRRREQREAEKRGRAAAMAEPEDERDRAELIDDDQPTSHVEILGGTS